MKYGTRTKVVMRTVCWYLRIDCYDQPRPWHGDDADRHIDRSSRAPIKRARTIRDGKVLLLGARGMLLPVEAL